MEENSSRELGTFTLVCIFFVVLTGTLSFTMWTLNRDDSEALVLLIVVDKNSVGPGMLQLLDENRAVVWSENLNERELKNLEELEPETVFAIIGDGEFTWSESRNRRRIRSSSTERKGIARLVRCDRLKPRARGKYLAVPSLHALQTCYRHGRRLEEPGTSDDPGRLDLGSLYVDCEVVFGAELDELTDELRTDYRRCKTSGALNEEEQLRLEERFGEELIIDDRPNESDNTEASQIATNGNVLDPRAFVECSHVEIELFEDNFESPSHEALQRCRSLGVTATELKLGIATNPYPKVQRFDPSNLYVGCRDVFNGYIDYITTELKDDYKRCKSVEAIDEEMQRFLESKFSDALHEKHGRDSKIEKKPPTTIASSLSVYETIPSVTKNISSSVSRVSSNDSNGSNGSNSSDSRDNNGNNDGNNDGNNGTTTKRPDANRYAFANCERIENKAYIICIKVTKVYSTPIQYV